MGDKRSRYERLIEVMSNYKKGDQLSMVAIRKLIIMNVGASQRVINECLKTMIELSMIKEIDHLVFEVQ